MMLAVDVAHRLVDFSQLYLVPLEFVVANNFVDFDSPVPIHEHVVVTVRDGSPVRNELFVLRLTLVSKSLNEVLLRQFPLEHHRVDVLQEHRYAGRVGAYHLDYQLQKRVLLQVLAQGWQNHVLRQSQFQEEGCRKRHAQGVDVCVAAVIAGKISKSFIFHVGPELWIGVVRHTNDGVSLILLASEHL